MKWFVNCFCPTLSCQFIKKKQISCMLCSSVLCENTYIPAMRLLCRLHSSCALIISVFKICQKGKVTFSLVISTAGKENHETSSTGLTWTLWPADVWSSCIRYLHQLAVTESTTLTWRKGRVQFLYHSNLIYRTQYIIFWSSW